MTELLAMLLERLIEALPLIAAAVVPVIVAAIRRAVRDRIPDYAWPVLLPIAGAVVATLARLGGADIGDFNPSTAGLSAWETAVAGALTGAASVGMHQLVRQLRKAAAPLDEDPPGPVERFPPAPRPAPPPPDE